MNIKNKKGRIKMIKYFGKKVILASLCTGLYGSGAAASEFQPYVMSELKELPPIDKNTVYGDKIRRTMHLLSSSTKENPNKVKIVFFGQSITKQNFSRQIIETKLRKRYPTAQLEVLNTAIGGYTAERSMHILHHQLLHHQPDLIVFHVYGGERDGEYEQVLKDIRKYTTAELICVTHHLDNYGETNTLKKDRASQLRRDLAEKYGAELVEVRKNWGTYLKMHNLELTQLIKDKIHHNTHGGELWGALQARHIEEQPVKPESWQNTIDRIKLGASSKGTLGKVEYNKRKWKKSGNEITTSAKGAPLKITFEGTRVDVTSLKGKGIADILIDGKSCTEFPETWAATLPTKTPYDYRPTIMRVGLKGKPVAETWTLTANEVSKDGKEFSYSLKGSISGEQGSGDHTAVFTSKNGVIELKPEVFTYDHAVKIKKKPIPAGSTTTWDVFNTGLEKWKCVGKTAENPSGQVTLVQQLENKQHTLEIIPVSGSISISEVIIYKPKEIL